MRRYAERMFEKVGIYVCGLEFRYYLNNLLGQEGVPIKFYERIKF